MSKTLSIQIDEELYTKLNNQERKSEDIITEAINQFFKNKEENEEQNNEIVNLLKQNIKLLEKQNEFLEIENVCFKQENRDLKTRIDDLAQMFPSAGALLGKADELQEIKNTESQEIKKKKWIFSK